MLLAVQLYFFLSLKKKRWTKGIPNARSLAWIWVSIWLWVEAGWMASVCPPLKMRRLLWGLDVVDSERDSERPYSSGFLNLGQRVLSRSDELFFFVLTSQFIPGLWETDICVFRQVLLNSNWQKLEKIEAIMYQLLWLSSPVASLNALSTRFLPPWQSVSIYFFASLIHFSAGFPTPLSVVVIKLSKRVWISSWTQQNFDVNSG